VSAESDERTDESLPTRDDDRSVEITIPPHRDKPVTYRVKS